MSTQWHPLFARLLKLLLEEHYEVQTEVPVSDLPRRGDLLLVRRQPGHTSPFKGLWGHLTDWNLVELKGPSDDPEEDDLELLMYVGTGLTYRFNEERKQRKEPRLENRQVSFWYLAPKLGETFLGQARLLTFLDHRLGGLWRGTAWGHPVWLLAYRDAPVEEDTVPLHLLGPQPSEPKALGQLVSQHEELLWRFAPWLFALHPKFWEEVRHMAGTSTDGPHLDWETIGKHVDLGEVIRVLPPQQAINNLGVERAIDTIGLQRVIEAIGEQKLLAELLARVPVEQVQEMLRRRQQGSAAGDTGKT